MSGPDSAPSSSTLISVEGRVREISFQSEESGYTVLHCKDLASQKVIVMVGDMPLVKEGERLTFQGKWVNHPRFGKQFRVQSYESIMPTSPEGIESFLASGQLRGVGPVTAKRLVEHFGEATLQILDQAPERLEEVPGLGERKVVQILASWREQRGLQPLLQFLNRFGLSPQLAPRLFKEYGTQAAQALQNQPYDLARLWGQGFASADRFARLLAESQDLPWQANHPDRLQVGIKHVLQQALRDGHLSLPLPELLTQASQLLGLPQSEIAAALEKLLSERELWPELRLTPTVPNTPPLYDIYLYRYGKAEQEAAERLKELLSDLPPLDSDRFAAWLENYQAEQKMDFSEGQRQAIEAAVRHKVMILTGGPGTGKTTVSKAILAWFKDQKLRYKLASPTGRAARRLSEVTGDEALTLHRLLEFDPQLKCFIRGADEPLKSDLVLLDEISMVEMTLFNDLLKALPDACRLILIGDSDQLPSVGPGAVLAELLQSKVIPAVKLTEIYRQAQASRIVRNAHRVNQGEPPVLLPPTGRNRSEDAFFIASTQPDDTTTQLLDLVSRRLPAAGYAPTDIQVLCPMRKGQIGTQALNRALQAVLNPAPASLTPESEVQVSHQRLRLGDRVIQLKNNYELEIFNGDLGQVVEVYPGERRLKVAFVDKTVEIADDQLQELDLAYALTIHKSQGAEFPVVILLLTRQHHIMLQRNLLYTGMTRAQKLLVLMGDPWAIERAAQNERLKHRNTRLGERLQVLFGADPAAAIDLSEAPVHMP